MRVIVVGGGIAGCFCAIELARKGLKVTILEKKNRILKKMLVTGNGRCNLTNLNLNSKKYYSSDKFVETAISEFDNDFFSYYLKTIGILTSVEGEGRVYPITLKAQSVVSAILSELEDLGVEILCQKRVISIDKDRIFYLRTNEEVFEADRVIFAVGGSSYPNLGSDGKSYSILEKLGHKKTSIFPALTQINLDCKYLKHLSGVKVNGQIALYKGDNLIGKDSGEILFTNYGLSGPPVLNLSRSVNLYKGLHIRMPLVNNIGDMKALKEDFYNSYYSLYNYSLERWLNGIVDKKFIHYLTDSLNLDTNLVVSALSKNNLDILFNLIFSSKFFILDNRGFENSQVTLGGMDLDQINEKTMESSLVKGLYIIGEVLNVDGECGGYNIQWAFSSAMLAAKDI